MINFVFAMELVPNKGLVRFLSIYTKRTKLIYIRSKTYMLAKRKRLFLFSPALFLWLVPFCYLCI